MPMALPVLLLLAAPPAGAGCPEPAPWFRPDRPVPRRPQALTPDGAVHTLTGDAERVCWWSVDDRGDLRLHRAWSRASGAPEALAALADGALVFLRPIGGEWALEVVGPDGGERRFPTWGRGEPAGIAAGPEPGTVEVRWRDVDHTLVRARVSVVDGALLELRREREDQR